MYLRMKLSLLCLTAVMMLGLSGRVSGTELTWNFEETLKGLKSWQKQMAVLDDKVTLGGKPAIRLQNKGILKKTFILEKGAKYELTFYVKGRNVEGGARKGTLVMFEGAGKWRRISGSEGNGPDSGSFDWRKGQGIVDCAWFGTNKISFYPAIRGTGEAWYSQFKLRKLTPSKEVLQAKKLSFNMDLFPANMDGNKISFCENLPGMLEIVSSGKGNYKGKTGEFVIQIPSYMKLVSACETLTLSRRSKSERLPAPVKSSTVVRDGKKYNQYVIPFSQIWLDWINMYWYRHILYFDLEKGSAGKKDKIYYSCRIGNEKQPERTLALSVLKPVKFPQKACKEFGVWVARLQSRYVPVPALGDKVLKFWSSLSNKRYTCFGHARDQKITYPGFERMATLGINHLYNTLTHQEAADLLKIMPRDVTDSGKVNPRGYVSVWSMVDDPDGHYDKYVRNILRKMKAHYGPFKHLWWDFEPHPFGYDEGGRKRFARKMGLKKVPTVEEIRKKYSDQWFNYMVKLHAELVAKNVRIFKEELPGVKFWFCSDNLHAAPPRLARWCGIDVSLSDDVTDVHNHMPYYASTRYYDDMAYNVKSLKKPYFPLIDPAERSKSFYSQYSAPKVFQNIVATAALGGIGIGFWPDDVLQGEYYHGIANGFAFVAEAEDYYRKGQRCDAQVRVRARNVVARRLKNGKEITYPDFSTSIRHTAHKLNGKTLVTVFNYDEKRTLIAEVAIAGQKPFLVKVPPEGCVLTGSGRIPAQGPLQKEVSRFAGDSSIFRDQIKGKLAVRWNSAFNGVPVLEMSNGKLIAGVDAFAGCNVVTFRTADQKEFFRSGFAGCLMFNDSLYRILTFKRTAHGFTAQGNPFVEVEAVIPQFTGGASSVPHPLFGMMIRRRMELLSDRLVITHTFRNQGKKSVKLSCRFNNFPHVGYRFKADNVFLGEYDRTSPGEVKINRLVRKGEKIVLKAISGALQDVLTFVPMHDYEGIFSWTQKSALPRKTMEFCVEKSVAPGAELVRSYAIIPQP